MMTTPYMRRVEALQQLLVEHDVDIAVLQYATDLYYYTGSVQPLYLLVPRAGAACVVARKALSRIAHEVTHLRLCPFASSRDLAAVVEEMGGAEARRVAYTLDTISAASLQRLQRFFPQGETVDLSWEIRTLRMVKDADEQAIVTRAGEIMGIIPDVVREQFRPGMTELELTAALEYALRLRGHGGLIRCRREGVEMANGGVCSAGAHTLAGTKFEGITGGTGLSAAIPYGATGEVIPPGAPLLIDIAFVLDGYHCDQTRMACWGQPSAEITAAYTAMRKIEEAVFAALRPGVPCETLYALAAGMATDLGYAATFMGTGGEQVKFVGHGVGLELDEPPYLAPGMHAPLEPGMTLAIEPKVALPGVGVVGIEDTVLIREDGVKRLTHCSQEMILLG